jgi:hypothetical protein
MSAFKKKVKFKEQIANSAEWARLAELEQRRSTYDD